VVTLSRQKKQDSLLLAADPNDKLKLNLEVYLNNKIALNVLSTTVLLSSSILTDYNKECDIS